MKVYMSIIALFFVLVLSGCKTPGATSGQAGVHQADSLEWQREFGIDKCNLVTSGKNLYFIMEPGFQLLLESENEKLAITVLKDTENVGGVITRVVEEREWKYGELIEVSRNFFVMCKETKDVFYFGEDVDYYRDDQVVGHAGAWRADTPEVKPGLIMSGEPKIGMRYYQEIAPGVAMDRAEVISLTESFKTPAGTFEQCLKTKEGSGLKFWEREYKIYAPGIGIIKDGYMRLVKYGFIKN
jgi:hypothetical protein